MAGYAYPVGTTTDSNNGSAGSVSVLLDTTDLVTVFTATTKTKITSVLLTNVYGTIVPVVLMLNDGETDKDLTTVRVLKNKYAVQPLITGDNRIDDGVYDSPILTELVLLPGESLKASCRIPDIVTVGVNYLGGIN